MREFLETGFKLGKYEITWVDLLVLLATFVIAQILVWLSRWLLSRMMATRIADRGVRFMIFRLMKTTVYIVATVVGLESIGVDLTILFAGSAALLVGVGIGLQNFFNDVVSGFVLLFEGGVRVGDELEVEGQLVRVQRIDLRSTRVVTRLGDLIVMPNGLISGASVLNYSQGTALTMLNIEVGVAYGSDTALVAALLTHAVEVQKEIVHDAPIRVVFDAFGSSSLDFKVRCSVRSPWDRERIQSEIRFRIDQSFRKAGVHIPFPQQDLHVKSWPENLAPPRKGESPSSED